MPDNRIGLLILLTIFLGGCTNSPPENPNNICEIFTDKRGWYKKARKSSRRWETDMPAMMAIMYQESSFKARAKPPRKRILGFIPWRRPASAFGYAQALDGTWEDYKEASGRKGADRNDFADAVDFIGWYNHRTQRMHGVSKTDANSLYLAYHEGHGGFARRSYKKKQWLKDVAKKVTKRTGNYRVQLEKCEDKLGRGFFRRLFGL